MKRQLVSGFLKPGERVAPVRELALEYGVNPNTMQKALSELERAGYFVSERTSGRCVTADGALIERLRELEHDAVMGGFVEQTDALGIPREGLCERLSDYLLKHQEGGGML
jgi:DNA-binding transcriptional regulator YhcF (GntR family)